jgi:hypothetical protein
MKNQIEMVAQTFYETMYPGQKWQAMPRKSSMKAMMLHAAGRVLEKISMPTVTGELFPEAGTISRRNIAVIDHWPRDYCEQFWSTYPHKIGKADALSVLDKLHSKTKDRPEWTHLMTGLRRYIENKPDDRNWCNPATWLRQHRWLDEPAPHVHNGARGNNGFANIALMDD